MTALHIFDLDGTLMRQSACLEIAKRVGKHRDVSLIEGLWRSGEIAHADYYVRVLPILGIPAIEVLTQAFSDADWLSDITKTFDDIAARGEHSLVITMSPQFYADGLTSMGVDVAIGSAVSLGTAVDPECVLTPESKRTIAREVMDLRNVPLMRSVAYGDGPSDMALFDLMPNTVSVNGTEALEKNASAVYRGSSIFEAYEIGRQLLADI